MPADSHLCSTIEEQLMAACDELHRRLAAGEPCCAEEFLSTNPALASDPHLAVALICKEFAVRRALGEATDPEECYRRFPQWSDLLRRKLEEGSDSATHPATEADPGPLTTPEGPAAAPAPAAAPRYDLLDELGRGGMGVVYRARDTLLNRVVALKVIRTPGRPSREELRRFHREAQAAARLRHRHIMPLHDFGEHADQPYFTMPYVTGGSLARRLGEFAADARAAVALVEKVARAVQVAHAAGIVHRDLKPTNILLDEDGEPLVTDFGLAKFLDEDGDTEPTCTGQMLGTPAYMAPEQAAGHANRATPASDVWALGVVLYELLTGRRPFLGAGSAVSDQVRTAEPPPPRQARPGLDRALETVVLKCLRKEPGQRYATAGDLADDLGRWLRGEAVRARPDSLLRRVGRGVRRRATWVTPAVLLLLLALAAGVWLLGHSRAQSPSDRSPQVEALAALEGELDAGRPVTLVPATGLPRYYRWRTEQKRPPLAPQGPNPLYVESYSTTLLDLLPDPRTEGYRFSAEVNLEETHDGSAGLYFLAEERASVQGTEQHFVALTFADQGSLGGRVWLQAFRYREAGAEHNFDRRDLILRTAPVGAPGWHDLSVEVKGHEIAATCDGKALPKLDLARDGGTIAGWWEAQDPRGAPPPAFAARSPLGLFVRRGTAVFRNVVVTPLPSAQAQ